MNHRFVPSLRSLPGLLAISICGFSQDNAPEVTTRDTPTTFSSRVTLVMVPVVVRDKQGKAVGTLKKEDFQLFDRGKPQVIARFSVEKSDGRVVPMEVAATDPDAPKPPEGLPLANRFVAYLFDDMHTTFGDLAQARIAAIKHLATALQGADRAAIFTTSGQNVLDFTDDREKLADTMNKIMPRSRMTRAVNSCPDVSEYMADLIQNKNDPTALNALVQDTIQCTGGPPFLPPSAAEAQVRGAATMALSIGEADTQITLSTLKAVVQRMAAMPGQRTVVMVSSGFLVTTNYRQTEGEVIDRAIRSNVTISALDARGLYAITPGGDASESSRTISGSRIKARYQMEAAEVQGEVLGELADGTGGTFFHNNNDLQEGFRRTGATPEFIYLLGFFLPEFEVRRKFSPAEGDREGYAQRHFAGAARLLRAQAWNHSGGRCPGRNPGGRLFA